MKKYAMYPISIWFLIYLGIFLLFSQLSTGKGPFKILCQSGKITNTQGKTHEDRNRCRTIC